nr:MULTISPECIES: hypothetical protein [Cryobacterium]
MSLALRRAANAVAQSQRSKLQGMVDHGDAHEKARARRGRVRQHERPARGRDRRKHKRAVALIGIGGTPQLPRNVDAAARAHEFTAADQGVDGV